MKTGKREQKNRRRFSKAIVVFCVVMVTLFGIATYVLVYKAGIEADKTLGILVGFFGGELLFLALKDIFRKPEPKEKTEEKTNVERDC